MTREDHETYNGFSTEALRILHTWGLEVERSIYNFARCTVRTSGDLVIIYSRNENDRRTAAEKLKLIDSGKELTDKLSANGEHH